MSAKNVNKAHLKHTLNALDNAVDQWNSLTNKDKGEQASPDGKMAESAKTLLRQLREQLEEFGVEENEESTSTTDTTENSHEQPPSENA